MTEKTETKALATRSDERLISSDSGQFSMYLDTAKFEHLWRVSQAFAKSDMVPVLFKAHPENVMIALEMAMRLAISPMMLMQNTYPIQGKIGMEAKLAIALINSSGLFDDPLEFDIRGSAATNDLCCRAFAMRKGKRVDGPWVTWEIVKAEGWLAKSGSKWKTMPELMIQYRAATFFGRMICPERLMGMQTVEEIEDVGPAKEVKTSALKERFGLETVSEEKAIDQEPPRMAEPPSELAPESPETPQNASPGTLSGSRLALWEKVAEIACGDLAEANKVLSGLSMKKIPNMEALETAPEGLVAEILGKIVRK